ncbi:hypothetical protein [Methanoregula sp.]
MLRQPSDPRCCHVRMRADTPGAEQDDGDEEKKTRDFLQSGP